MLEGLKSLYKSAAEKIIEVESDLHGKAGEEKQSAVVEYLADLIDISFIPNFIERPLKRAVFAFISDVIVEKLNWLTNWNFAGTKLTPEQTDKWADVAHAPLSVITSAPAEASLDEKLEALYRHYKIEPAEPAPTPEPMPETAPEPEPVTDNFPQSIAFTLKWEGAKNYTGEANGKYVMKNKADKGGPTNMGIVRGTLAAAYAQGLVKHNNLDVLTKGEASEIYRKNFWDRNGWDALTWPSCLCALDCSVNHGGFAWILQRACNDLGAKLDIDGKYGPKTRAALIALSVSKPKGLALAIANQRKVYYDGIVEKDEGQRKNLKGWYNRLRDMAEAAGITSPV